MNKNKNLLIVDDSSLNIELLMDTLAPFEFNITACSNPVEALEKSRNEKFDLAMFDVIMPEMNGFEVAEKFKKTHPNTPVIFVSAHGTSENKIKGFNLGSYAYIEKPFDIETIRAQVGSILKIKSLQDELFAEKKKFDNMLAFTNNEVILTDLDFNITAKNNRILSNKDLDAPNFIDLLKNYAQKEIVELFLDFCKSEESYKVFRVGFENVTTSMKISKILNSQNKPAGYLIVIMDISDEIRNINQREQFIATLTHDLKTPIRAESQALELLLSGTFGQLTAEQEDIVREIYNSSKFMAQMTDNLLVRYRIDGGEICLQKDFNSIKITIEKCAKNMKYLLEARNQRLKINIDIMDDSFSYDDLEITRAINNLLTNASEYSGENSEIIIQASKVDDNIEISVIDNGPGISNEEIKTIFNEYTTSAKKFKKVGTGIGLYITKKIIEAHNGKIQAVSKPGKGSCFTFLLPYSMSVAAEV